MKQAWFCPGCADSEAEESDEEDDEESEEEIVEIPPKKNSPKKRRTILGDEKTANTGGKLDMLLKQNEKILKKLETIEKENKQMKQALREIREENANLKKEVNILKKQKETYKQDSLKNNIIINGLPVNKNTKRRELTDYVLCIAKKLDVDMTDQDLKCTKIDKEGSELVKVVLSNSELKESIMQNKKNTDLNTNIIGLSVEDKIIHINHDMTPQNQLLLKKAREIKKLNKVKYAWYKDGKVFVRKSDSSPILRIKSEEELENLKKN